MVGTLEGSVVDTAGPAGRCFVRLLSGGVAWRGRRISGWHLRYLLGTCCSIISELQFEFDGIYWKLCGRTDANLYNCIQIGSGSSLSEDR